MKSEGMADYFSYLLPLLLLLHLGMELSGMIS